MKLRETIHDSESQRLAQRVANLRAPAGLERYDRLLRGLLDAGKVDMEVVRRKFLCLHGEREDAD